MRILVPSTGNSYRSPMAEGYLRHFTNGCEEVVSAGTEQHGLDPSAAEVMAEDGIDISHHFSNVVDTVLDRPYDLVITVCDHANERRPYLAGPAERMHRNFPMRRKPRAQRKSSSPHSSAHVTCSSASANTSKDLPYHGTLRTCGRA